jgi:hypothetical protein
MIIHDDADMETVVQETVAALKESAKHVGKADRAVTTEQITEIEAAMGQLQNALDLKKRAEPTS